MKILLIVTNSDLAGAPLHVKEVALSLIRDGYNVSVIFGSTGPTQKSLQELGVKTHVVSGMRSIINPVVDFFIFLRLFFLVKKIDPDVIHCHSAKAGMLSRIVGFFLGVPCVYTIHGWGFGPGRKKIFSIVSYLLEYLLKKITSHFISVSEFDRLSGIDILKISPDNITTIRNGISFSVSCSSFRSPRSKVIMVARNAFPKDYITLAHALSSGVVGHAVFVGEGTDSDDFILKIREIVKDNCFVEFCGVREDISDLLESASIFVLSSRYEALPLSIIEAMAKGLPVIASDVGGVKELISHGINGFLFPAGDSSALMGYLAQLGNDLRLRQQMGGESVRRYQNDYSSEIMMKKIRGVYELVKSHG